MGSLLITTEDKMDVIRTEPFIELVSGPVYDFRSRFDRTFYILLHN